MSLETWLGFIVACCALCFTPGPTVFMLMATALKQGKKAVVPLLLGVGLGDVVAMSLSFLGLGAILASSALAFNLVKVLGAGYLLYLAIKAFRDKGSQVGEVASVSAKSKQKVFRDAFWVTALNPKGVVFFMAFFPLFINPEQPLTMQMSVLGASFLAVSITSVTCYTFAASKLTDKIKTPNAQRWFNRISGSLLATASGVTLLLKRS